MKGKGHMRIFVAISTAIIFLLPFKAISQKVQEGYNKLYYPSGKLSSEGTIRNGKPDGYWKTYYESGKIKSEGNRKNFQLDSIWKFYNSNGLMYVSYYYGNGKKNGYKSNYSPDPKDSTKGILVSKENFINDTLQGNGYYYKKGKLHQIITYKDGLAEGKSYEFSPDSLITSIIYYKGGFVKKVEKLNQYNTQGHKEGLWETFFVSGVVKWEGTYSDGKREGYFKTYDEKGSLVTIEKYINDVLQVDAPELAKLEVKTDYYSNGVVKESGPYKNDKPYGTHRMYDESGKEVKADIFDSGRIVAEGILDSTGMQQGDWKEFHENGKIKSEGKYVNGVKVGQWKYYFPDGKMFEIGKYDNKGRQQGKWLWYFEGGKLRRESNFYNGLEDAEFIEYSDSTGSVITKGQYTEGLKEGIWMYQLGEYKSVGKYTDDQQDSTWREYYVSSGKVRFEGSYNQGRADGKHMWYYDDGRLELEGRYSMGMMEDKWKFYTPDGNLYLTITYKDDVEILYDSKKVEP
jgi:antitoxin component YwqK of YwqJK toxin-antitoxin module